MYRDNSKEIIDCKRTRCELSDPHLFWYNQQKSTLERDKIYFYPTAQSNSIDIKIDESKLNSHNRNNDICVKIEYFAENGRNAILDVAYSVANDSTKDTFLSIKLRAEKEESTICLHDYIALIARDAVITFSATHNKYNRGVNGFALRIANFNYKNIWKLPSIKKLSAMNGNWHDEWSVTYPNSPKSNAFYETDRKFFKLLSDSISFSGITNTVLMTN